MKSIGKTRPVGTETAEVLEALGFTEERPRAYVHRVLADAGRFDASAIADEAIVRQAVEWIEAAAHARGRAGFRKDLLDALA